MHTAKLLALGNAVSLLEETIYPTPTPPPTASLWTINMLKQSGVYNLGTRIPVDAYHWECLEVQLSEQKFLNANFTLSTKLLKWFTHSILSVGVQFLAGNVKVVEDLFTKYFTRVALIMSVSFLGNILLVERGNWDVFFPGEVFALFTKVCDWSADFAVMHGRTGNVGNHCNETRYSGY